VSAVRDDGLPQSGQLTSLSLVFNVDVSDGLDVRDLFITNTSTGTEAVLSDAVLTWNGQSNTARWDMAGLGFEPGHYVAGIRDGRVMDSAGSGLDGDLDGFEGGDYSFEFDLAIVVSSAHDEQDGSWAYGSLALREALAIAVELPGEDTILFDASLAGETIPLLLGQLRITSDVDIRGPETGRVCIDAGGMSRVFHVAEGVTASLANLQITGGSAFSYEMGEPEETQETWGGGIYNEGTLSLASCEISENTALCYGGGIYNAGTLNVLDSAIVNNSIPEYDGGCGGGLFSRLGVIDVSGSTVAGNSSAGDGGGIACVGSTLTVANSTVSGNSAAVLGGGIMVAYATTDLTGCTVSDNFVGCYVEGDVDGAGGGLYVEDGVLTAINTTVSSNSSALAHAGIGSYGAAVTIVNGTVAHNRSAVGLPADAATQVFPGVYGDSVTLQNSILVGNVDSRGGLALAYDLGCPVAQESSHNIVGATDVGVGCVENGVNGNIVGVTDLSWLGALADNGGAILTNALLVGSPAIDAANGDLAPMMDAIGHVRHDDPGMPNVGTGTPPYADIGAFEFQGSSLVPEIDLQGNGQSIADGDAAPDVGDGTDFGDSLVEGGTVTRTFMIQNTGSGALTLTGSPFVEITGPNESDFSVTAQLSDTLAPGASTAFNVRFDPSSLGLRTATIVIANSDADEDPYNFDIQGTGTGPFVVTTEEDEMDPEFDPDDLSLREALASAAERAGQDTIEFDPSLEGKTIRLQLGQLDIDSDVEINGPGPAKLTIDAGGHSRVLYVDEEVVASVSGLAIAGGYAAIESDEGRGGGIRNHGELTLSDCVVADNSSAAWGGGISSAGTLTADAIIVRGNWTDVGSETDGGGIDNSFATMTLTNSTITSNTADAKGGGITNSGMLDLIDVVVTNNVARTWGGGLYNYDGPVTLMNTTISANSADFGGGILSSGALTLMNSTVSGNSASSSGGGVYNHYGTATLTNSTVSGNLSGANGGGLRNNFGTVMLTNSTVSANSASNSGGGIYDSGTATLTNTIVAINVVGTAAPVPGDVVGDFEAAGSHNLIGSIDGSTGLGSGTGTLHGTAAEPLDPRLGQLTDNGGSTKTHALLTGSPAVNAGSNARTAEAGLITDQRGMDRFIYSTVDIGAFEYCLSGDANVDGRVDYVDYLTIKRHLGTSSGADWSKADFDGDGDVDRDDLMMMVGNFGNVIPLAPAAPEALTESTTSDDTEPAEVPEQANDAPATAAVPLPSEHQDEGIPAEPPAVSAASPQAAEVVAEALSPLEIGSQLPGPTKEAEVLVVASGPIPAERMDALTSDQVVEARPEWNAPSLNVLEQDCLDVLFLAPLLPVPL